MRTVLRIALLGALVGACGGKKQEPPPPPPRQGVEMVSHGAMPHQTLRYQLTKGVKTEIEQELDLDIASAQVQRAMPTAVTVMEVAADDVLPDGNAKVRTTILRASARDRPGAKVPVEVLNAQGMMLNGVTITGTLTPRGKLGGPQIAGGSNLPPKASEGFAALAAQADEVAMPLPEPAIGVGAVWRVRRDLVQLGIKMETITELQVTAIDGPRVSYTMRAEVKGDNQRAMIEGTQVDVSNIRGSGSGKGVLDLSRMVNLGEQTLELAFEIKAAGVPDTVKIRTEKRTRPSSGEPPTPSVPAPSEGSASAPQQQPEPRSQDPGSH
jgi:hypothetical protein